MEDNKPSPFDPGYQPTHTFEHHVTHKYLPSEMSFDSNLGEIVFETGSQTFHFIPASKMQEFKSAIQWLTPVIQNLVEANMYPPQDEAEASYCAQKKSYFNAILKPLVHGKGANDICELINLTSHCWHYVRAHDFKTIAKTSYCITKKVAQDVIMENGKLSLHKLLNVLVGPKAFHYHKQVSGAMTPLANALGMKPEDIQKVFCSNPNDKYMGYTANADAQLMRYTSGLSLAGSFNPENPQFGFSLNATTKLTLASAALDIDCFMPSETGYHAHFLAKLDKHSKLIDLGYMRSIFGLGVDGFVGTSIQAMVALHCSMDKKTGQPHVHGANVPDKYDKFNPPNYGVKATANAFVGAKAGGKVSAQCQWINPEKDKNWDTLAKISAAGDLAAGAGIDSSFYIIYNAAKSTFVIHAEAGLVFGIGASGSINVLVDKHTIESFIHFVYHKLMNAEYYFINIFAHEAFKMLVNIYTMFIFEAEKSIAHIFEHELTKIEGWWDTLVANMKDGINLTDLYQVVDNINADPKRFKFALPEVKGRFLYMMTRTNIPKAVFDDAISNLSFIDYEAEGFHDLLHWNWHDDSELNRKVKHFYQAKMHQIETAILNVLSYIQSRSEYANTITHMSLDPWKKNGAKEGEHMLYENLVNEGFDFSRLKSFKVGLAITKKRPENKTVQDKERILIYSGLANYNEPVKPNKTVLGIINNVQTVIEELEKYAASTK